jgi:large subunit ribosomal protein L9e
VKDLSHLAVSFGRPEKNIISIELHHGSRKSVATLRTVRTLLSNLVIGVTRGFKYKMRYVYAHFPINLNIDKNAETDQFDIEIRYDGFFVPCFVLVLLSISFWRNGVCE